MVISHVGYCTVYHTVQYRTVQYRMRYYNNLAQNELLIIFRHIKNQLLLEKVAASSHSPLSCIMTFSYSIIVSYLAI